MLPKITQVKTRRTEKKKEDSFGSQSTIGLFITEKRKRLFAQLAPPTVKCRRELSIFNTKRVLIIGRKVQRR